MAALYNVFTSFFVWENILNMFTTSYAKAKVTLQIKVRELWNELPKEIRHISSISVFKTSLKTPPFKLAFSI